MNQIWLCLAFSENSQVLPPAVASFWGHFHPLDAIQGHQFLPETSRFESEITASGKNSPITTEKADVAGGIILTLWDVEVMFCNSIVIYNEKQRQSQCILPSPPPFYDPRVPPKYNANIQHQKNGWFLRIGGWRGGKKKGGNGDVKGLQAKHSRFLSLKIPQNSQNIFGSYDYPHFSLPSNLQNI